MRAICASTNERSQAARLASAAFEREFHCLAIDACCRVSSINQTTSFHSTDACRFAARQHSLKSNAGDANKKRV